MSEDIVKLRGTFKAYQDDRGGASLIPHPVIGIVRNNVDPMHSGKIQVYINRLNSAEDDNPAYWTTVSYMSPFFGYTPNTGSPDSDGKYINNPNSYGFWATPPDIGTQVVCIFVNGDPNFGYYIGGIPIEGLIHMTPAVGASSNVIPNTGEADGYGGATRLPVSEYNNANTKQNNSPVLTDQPRPVHSWQAAILNKQGLIRDPDRGAISSSGQRESPSRVFGMSTPGRPIYQGGYTDETIGNAVKQQDIPDNNFKVVGRRGGHTLVMDDGDLQGRDQLLRLRTSTGHMIMMNDYAQTLFIIHANGQSYIELGKEGTIDMYSTNSVNIRTQGDLNLHADNNININAAKDLNISATNVNVESLEATNQFVGSTFKQYTMGSHTVKVDEKMSFQSAGDSMIKSGGTNYLKGGPNVHLNTGESSLSPEKVKQLPVVAHTDTLYSNSKGYAPAPGKLASIVSRAPAHSPWANANQGVDVKTDIGADSNLPSDPSAALQQVNSSLESVSPEGLTSAALAASVPGVGAALGGMSAATGSAMLSQMALTAANGPAAAAIARTAGVVATAGVTTAALGSLGVNPSQLVAAGNLKPGADVAINAALQSGKTLAQAMPPNVWTGKDGVNSVAGFINNTQAQTSVASRLLNQSKSALESLGMISKTNSPTQTAGIMLSATTVGLGATLQFAQNAMSPTSDLSKVATGDISNLKNNLTGAIGKLGTQANDIGGSVKNAMASGNFAANLADKALGALGGIKIGDSLKGIAAGAFAKITGGFKALTANKPQNLATAGSEGADADLTAALKEAAGAGIPGIPNIPGGAGAVTNVVSGLPGASNASVGTAGVNQALQSVTGSIPNGIPSLGPQLQNQLIQAGTTAALASVGINPATLSLAKNALSIAGKMNLTSMATGGLPGGAAADLQGALASLGSGGSVSVKAPTVAKDSFNFQSILGQSKTLLGDPKIPPLNFGALNIPKTANDPGMIKQYDTLKGDLTTQEDLQWDLRKKYLDAVEKYGSNSSEAQSAEAPYKECLQKIEQLRTQIAGLATGTSA
jgi:hypothetical protein